MSTTGDDRSSTAAAPGASGAGDGTSTPVGTATGAGSGVGSTPGSTIGAGPVPVDGGGHYRRDPDGGWRRSDGTPVRGAQDVRLGDLYDPPAVVDDDGAAVRRVPRAWARRHPDHPLAWVFAYAETGSRGPIDVPSAAWDARADDVVGLVAPELHHTQLLGVDEVAQLIGIAPATVRAYVSRRQFPDAVSRVGGSPAWTRWVVERWMDGRRRTPPPRP